VDTVIATFTRRATAERAAAKVRAELGSDLVVAVGEREDVLDALAVNQRAEIGDAAMAPSVGFWTGPMIRGGLVWGVVGLLAGAVLALPMLLVVDLPEDERWTFVLSVAAIGALALSSATSSSVRCAGRRRRVRSPPRIPGRSCGWSRARASTRW
jgi:hypothetical protein